MKKYFAKYLPVEEDYKKGDKVVRKSSPWVIHTYIPSFQNLDATELQKVKLFLCSNDIQVGDEYWYELHRGDWFQAICSSEGDAKNLRLQKYFKVVASISMEAVWVKDGDQFDEKELQFDYKMTFKKNKVLEGKESIVWQHPDPERCSFYWKYYEEMKYDPARSTKDTVFGWQNSSECEVPRDICIDITTVKVLNQSCKHFH